MRPDDTVIVRFPPSERVAIVPKGSTLYDAALEAEVRLDVPCGGLGRCRGCRVVGRGELSAPDAREQAALTAEELERGVRLACRARATGDAVVETRAAAAATSADAPYEFEPAEAARGVTPVAALDVGTTTLAASLVDPRTGDEIAAASAVNPQLSYGADVLSRISRASTGDTDALHRSLATEIEALLATLTGGTGASTPARIVAAGNTTMLHLLLGRDPSGMGTAPYTPEFVESQHLSAAEAGLPALGDAELVTLPAVSAFVGADTVAGLLATHVPEREGTVLLVDVGTNGEIVLKTADGALTATSAAAGPALEGATIECGMRAEPGAVERAWMHEEALHTSTIGDTPTRGICGSGLVDLVAVLLTEGVLDASGRLLMGAPSPLAARVVDADGQRRFELARGADGRSVHLTQQDIRQVQLAKGAVRAALELLLSEAGLSAADVDEVLVGGAFGHRLDPDAAVRIGLFPDSWRDRTLFVGNSSKAGAARVAAEPGLLDEAASLAASVRIVDLVGHDDFQQRFVDAMSFPANV
jgi:uncharacterized 2Fe-2S/4Fe-4S cluster protein (DUF4445 family)